jgi:hypothetical protein
MHYEPPRTPPHPMDLYRDSWKVCAPSIRRRRRQVAWPKWRERVLPAVSYPFLLAEADLEAGKSLPKLPLSENVCVGLPMCPMDDCG